MESGLEGAEVLPSVAYDCLDSVPVDVERDIGLIEWLLPYISFQSTLGYLKKPPQGYLLPGVDLVGGLVAMREKLRKGDYKSQYEFVVDIQRLYAASADSHFNYFPALGSAFIFRLNLNLTSLSSDGLELPKIYFADELDAVAAGKASAVVSINNATILDFLYEQAALEQTQDPDAQYNGLFYSFGGERISLVAAKAGGARIPDVSTVEFANGSTVEIPASVMVRNEVWLNATSGEDLHQMLEVPTEESLEWTNPMQPDAGHIIHVSHMMPRQEEEEETPPVEETVVTSLPYYPAPVAIHQHGYMSGYFLNDTEAHDDTAVLVLSSFMPSNDSWIKPTETAEVERTRKFISEFLDACAKAGRTKLVIDVSGNGGGLIFNAFEVYKSLFPTAKAWSGNRLRAHPALDHLGEASYDNPYETNVIGSRSLNPANGERYATWGDYYGPYRVGEDRATSLLVYDLANENIIDANVSFVITGFGPEPPNQPFAKEDIVVMTDGICASACTIFVGLLQREAGVRTIAVGGRPLEAPMQAVGGVKGSQVLTVQAIQLFWNVVIIEGNLTSFIPAEQIPVLPNNKMPPLLPHNLALTRVNSRNAYAEGSTDEFPTHFKYEAANCKRFIRPEYISDYTVAWADAADVAWHGAKCAPGSTVDKEGKISDDVLPYTDAVKSRISVYDGPGSLTNEDWIALSKNLTGSPEGLPGIEEDVKDEAAEEDKPSSAVRTAPALMALVVGLLVAL